MGLVAGVHVRNEVQVECWLWLRCEIGASPGFQVGNWWDIVAVQASWLCQRFEGSGGRLVHVA